MGIDSPFLSNTIEDVMTGNLRKRAFERRDHEAPIMFSCNPDHPYCYYGARMFNVSNGGLYFESRYALEPGTTVYFNRATYSLKAYAADTYKPFRVLVKWCKSLKGRKEYRFGIGVQFLDPASRPATDDTGNPTEPASLPNNDVAPDDNEHAGTCDAAKELDDSRRALEKAMEVAKSRANKLAVLNRFAASVGSTLDANEILQSVCREMTGVFGARNTGIGLLDRKRTKITLVAFHAADPGESDATGIEMPLEGNAATHRVVETGQAIVVPDVQHNPLTVSIHDLAKKRGTECLMIVPLLSRGEVIGTIGMPTADKDRVFSLEEVSLAQTIAGQIASAIENARLYEKTEKAREIAEHDLEIGRKIQTEFFPERLPDIKGWEIAAHFQPARKVSGDFYDHFPVHNNKYLGLVMADVCDHGVGAALFMVLFRSLIRAYAEPSFKACEAEHLPDDACIREALSRTIRLTNTYIATTHERSGMFATMFFGVLDPKTGRLYYLNCGHEAPLILGSEGVERALKPTGPALGLDEDHQFAIGRVDIAPDSMMFLYTDGATDAQNHDGDYFTKTRLMDFIVRPHSSAQSFIHELTTQLENHTSGADLYDDVTLMAVKHVSRNV